MNVDTDISKITNFQAEAGVIATFINHPEFVTHFGHLRPKCFYDESNQCLMWALQELVNKRGINNIDAFNLSNVLYSNNAVKHKIQQYNLTNLQEYVELSRFAARETLEEVKMLVDEVITLSFKRDLVMTLSQINSSCFKHETTLPELDRILDSKINTLTEKYLVSDSICKLGEKVDDIWESILSKRNTDGTFGLPSKFPHLNEYFTYCAGELIVVAGRMKSGKSIFMMNEAVDKLRKGIGVVYFDSEMSDELFFLRMLANISEVPINKVKSGCCTQEEHTKINSAKEWIKQQNFTHIYMPVTDLDAMYSTVKLLKARDNIGFVVYDYIKSYEGDSAAMISAIIGRITDRLKNQIAGELNIPVLAGAQLNRENNVSDSDKLARVASAIAIWRTKETEEITKDGSQCGNYCLRITHNRNGAQMDEDEYLDFWFEPGIMNISEAKEQHIPQEDTPFTEGVAHER